MAAMAQLTLHPDSHCTAVTGIDVTAVRPGPGLLKLRYVLRGTMSNVRLPPAAASARVDELWRHTCFEAFVGAPGTKAYFEFNLAPSLEWAAYRFDKYREGMDPADVGAPQVEVQRGDDRFELRALLDLRRAPEGPWRVGLSAVVEETNGDISWWALRHPPGKPDFHKADCFALELPESRGA
jgi:hypothetical protein